MAQTMVRTYKGESAYQKEAAKLAAQGWRVISVTPQPRRSGCARILLIGIFAAIFKPKPILIVTYQRD